MAWKMNIYAYVCVCYTHMYLHIHVCVVQFYKNMLVNAILSVCLAPLFMLPLLRKEFTHSLISCFYCLFFDVEIVKWLLGKSSSDSQAFVYNYCFWKHSLSLLPIWVESVPLEQQSAWEKRSVEGLTDCSLTLGSSNHVRGFQGSSLFSGPVLERFENTKQHTGISSLLFLVSLYWQGHKG